ncbi:GDSL esterase/lipase At5g55050 [Lycium barbarum]|uniref:GDSL esterase/lipase At5g55050 n=1 Tax=Lycium barbarum TaxID=112863 RepID=UPI00293F68D0|nr:GDSL esterase/lipase At5g55050 [Lycium barbarum]
MEACSSVKTKLLHSCCLIAILLLLQLNMLRAQKVTAMYVFGDSLVDVGNNNYFETIFRANFPFNGIDFPGGKPTGRFSNGKNAADFFAENVGLPTPPPYLSNKNDLFLKGVSFASGGAGILNSTNDHPLNGTIYLSKQVEYFTEVQQRLIKKIGESAAKRHMSSSLFAVVIGSNDLSKIPITKSPQEYIDLMLSTFADQLKKLQGLGAHKFVIVGIGQIGCIPAQRILNPTDNCNDKANYWARIYNKGLQSMLQKLKSQLKEDFNYSYFDIYSLSGDLIQNPTKYGFLEVKAACCGMGRLYADVPCIPISKYCPNRSDHFFWDKVHPTEAASKILVNTLFNDTKQYVTSMNLTKLLAL